MKNSCKKKRNNSYDGIFLLETHIAGTSYVENIDVLVSMLSERGYLNFVRDKENDFDDNAIMITSELGYKVGFIPRKDNKLIANLMDANKALYGKISTIENKNNWWCIEIGIYLCD